ncbi:hypothetical protein NJBCHELONAE_27040 [Mycobacteroides chelonae]|nr:hypothetical protein NJBCHELONAE_27040 [Mycobacteroides chelonae]
MHVEIGVFEQRSGGKEARGPRTDDGDVNGAHPRPSLSARQGAAAVVGYGLADRGLAAVLCGRVTPPMLATVTRVRG